MNSITERINVIHHVPSDTEKRRKAVKAKIQDIYDESKQNYGAPKITVELRKTGEVISEIYIVTGRTDMRKSIDGLCAIVEDQLHMDPRRSALYLFCGKRCDRIKALLWESDGFVLLYKRMEVQGRFRWPRNQLEVKQLTWQQFDWLMSGLEIEQPKAFKPTE